MSRALRRRRVLDTLGVVSDKIAQLLAGQDLDLSQVKLPQDMEPGETPLERLRRYKDLLQETLATLNRGEDPVCRGCGGAIPEAALDEMPWATACGRCPPA
ncbi:MAG: hypothetical protein KF878_14505 [Planctomycetes bacterium]|nr:hypothetical protein [Planctomycetota bacterium]